MTRTLEALFASIPPPVIHPHRPTVTLSYAQSLDGSIAATAGKGLQLSGPEAMKMTHQLRATHDGILVGIGTVLADNPQLTTRLVVGPHPQPIILDSHLRTPLQANIINHPNKVLIACAEGSQRERKTALREAGVELIVVSQEMGDYLNLEELLLSLKLRGIDSLMVEGGVEVITSFLSKELVDVLVLTIAPRLIGGLHAPGKLLETHPKLRDLDWIESEEDLIVWGNIEWLRQ
jgi:riboflavin-specific deaminase-like protein